MSYSINKSKFLTGDELEALNSLLSRYQLESPRDTLLIEISLKTGARASEVLNLKVSDLDHQDKTIFITGLKGSSDRAIPIGDQLYNRLAVYLRTQTLVDRIFPISYSMLVKIWNKYKPKGKGYHSLRHTFAIELYKKHKDLRLCQIALGHKNIKNTMVYAEYHYSTSELRRLVV